MDIFLSNAYKKEWNEFIYRLIDGTIKQHRRNGHCSICMNVNNALPSNKYRARFNKRIDRKLEEKFKSIKHTFRLREVIASKGKYSTQYYWPSKKIIPRIAWLSSLKF